MATKFLRRGMRGQDVRELQEKLHRLGFGLAIDGVFGEETEKAVLQLQTMFGYDIDGVVDQATNRLIDAQISYSWNVHLPDAQELALRAQGKQPGTQGGLGTGREGANVIEIPRSPTWPDAKHTAAPASSTSKIERDSNERPTRK
jgi:peptidoglycan hydrolase-like protein with peptidoglycan-binding domain